MKNKFSTVVPSVLANVRARKTDGTKTPFSTVLIVFRETPARSARAAWVRPCRARISFNRLFKSPSLKPTSPALEDGEKDCWNRYREKEHNGHAERRNISLIQAADIDKHRRDHDHDISYG